MTLDDLYDGMPVVVRTGRAGREDVEWGPWRPATLFLVRANKAIKSQGVLPGHIALLALKGEDWAEYTQQDWSPHDRLFLCEDYYLEIEGLT